MLRCQHLFVNHVNPGSHLIDLIVPIIAAKMAVCIGCCYDNLNRSQSNFGRPTIPALGCLLDQKDILILEEQKIYKNLNKDSNNLLLMT